MKQIIIGKNVALTTSVSEYAIGTATKDGYTPVPDGSIAIIDLTTKKAVSSADKLKNNFSVVCGRGENRMPIVFSEVDVKSMTVARATYSEGKKFKASITIDTVEKGKEYTLIVVKLGTVFNERFRWTFNAYAKDDTTNIAAELQKRIEKNEELLGLKATVAGYTLTLEGAKEGEGFEVVGSDSLMGVEITSPVPAEKARLDKAYVQDLASRCASDKGFNYTYSDGDSIYPGYPEIVDADQYDMWTLRFAVPRVSAKQRDEVVWQTLHIVAPVGSAQSSSLDTIFGTAPKTEGASAKAETPAIDPKVLDELKK